LRASLRPPLKLHVRFSRMQLSRRQLVPETRPRDNNRVDPFVTSVRWIRAASILGR